MGTMPQGAVFASPMTQAFYRGVGFRVQGNQVEQVHHTGCNQRLGILPPEMGNGTEENVEDEKETRVVEDLLG